MASAGENTPPEPPDPSVTDVASIFAKTSASSRRPGKRPAKASLASQWPSPSTCGTARASRPTSRPPRAGRSAGCQPRRASKNRSAA